MKQQLVQVIKWMVGDLVGECVIIIIIIISICSCLSVPAFSLCKKKKKCNTLISSYYR